MKTSIKYLTPLEVEELFFQISKDKSKYALRNKVIFYLAKYCALRVSEIGMLDITDYDSKLKQIYCRREKGSLNNTIRIVDKTVENALNDYFEIRELMFPDSSILFPSQRGLPISRKTLDNLMKNYCSGSSISKNKHHFHVLKHTRAIELANSGADIKDIQWWLGHKNINNTMIYMQFTTNQQENLYKKLENWSN